MKKFLVVLLSGLIILSCTPCYAADNWLPTEPAGTQSPSDIDTLVITNNEALERLNSNYRRGCFLTRSSASALSVGEGEVVCSNSAGTIRRFRQVTSSTAVAWSDIDTGSEVSSTQYYVWLLADVADSAAFTITVSESSSEPFGGTYYRLIGYFYNNSDGDIVNVGNYKEGDSSNIVQVSGTSDITTTATSYEDMADMEIYFVSSGRPILISFSSSVLTSSAVSVNLAFDVDGTDYGVGYNSGVNPADAHAHAHPISPEYMITGLAAGAHTIKAQWKVSSGTCSMSNSTWSTYRTLTVEEK